MGSETNMSRAATAPGFHALQWQIREMSPVGFFLMFLTDEQPSALVFQDSSVVTDGQSI